MAIYTGQVTVGSTPTAIDGADKNPIHIQLHNLDTTKDIYIGNSSVTTSTGYRLDKGMILEFTLNPNETIYAVSLLGGETIAYLKQVY